MNNRAFTIGALVLALVLFLAINIISQTKFTGVRLDLTDHKLFTLSEGTIKTLRSLEEPVNLRLYLSMKLATRLPSVSSYAARVRELLKEYALASEGKVNLSVIDPEPFSEEEDRAVSYGLQGVPLSDGESTFYFGVVGTNSLDDVVNIPYLTAEREEFLEYDITKLIYGLGNPKKKVIGLLSSLPLDGRSPRAAMTGRQGAAWLILEQIQGLFDVKTVASSAKKIPDDVDVLMIVHPKTLSDATLYAIDQFALKGGRILAFVDPNAEADRTQAIRGMPPLPTSSDLKKLLNVWGVDIDTSQTVGDLQLALRVQSRQGDRIVTSEYPPWLNVPQQLQNPDDIVTGKLGNLTFASAGAIKKVEGSSTTMTDLVRSTDSAMLLKNELIGPMADMQHLKRTFKPSGEQFVLAARLRGPAKSAFATAPTQKEDARNTDNKKGDAVEAKEGPKEEPTHLVESKKDINIIVVADADMLQDQFWVRAQNFLGQRLAVPISANANFVINALENLSGSADLISVRSRGRFLRPFSLVNELRQEAELKFREKETQLLDRLKATEKNLEGLQKSGGKGGLVVSGAQRQEIANFREEKVRIRGELREVRRELRKDIETLEGWLKFSNIGLLPLLIGVGGTVMGMYRIRRRRTTVVTA